MLFEAELIEQCSLVDLPMSHHDSRPASRSDCISKCHASQLRLFQQNRRRTSEIDVRFSNRPFGVKRFQTIHHLSVSVARGLVLLFGIGTKALPSWDSKTRWNNLPGGLAVSLTGVQADMRTHLIHRPARDIIPPLGGARVFSYRI